MIDDREFDSQYTTLSFKLNKNVQCGIVFNEFAVWNLLADIGHALFKIHEQKKYYRNVAPDSILSLGHNHFKLKDECLASSALDNDETTDFHCKLEYLAPELIHGSIYTEQCDIYSLGVVVFEMLLNKKPDITGELSESDLMNQLPTELSYQLKRIIIQCLNADSKQRITSKELVQNEAISSRIAESERFKEMEEQNIELQQEITKLKKREQFYIDENKKWKEATEILSVIGPELSMHIITLIHPYIQKSLNSSSLSSSPSSSLNSTMTTTSFLSSTTSHLTPSAPSANGTSAAVQKPATPQTQSIDNCASLPEYSSSAQPLPSASPSASPSPTTSPSPFSSTPQSTPSQRFDNTSSASFAQLGIPSSPATPFRSDRNTTFSSFSPLASTLTPTLASISTSSSSSSSASDRPVSSNQQSLPPPTALRCELTLFADILRQKELTAERRAAMTPVLLFRLFERVLQLRPVPRSVRDEICRIIATSLFGNGQHAEEVFTPGLGRELVEMIGLPLEELSGNHILALQRFTVPLSMKITKQLVDAGCLHALIKLLSIRSESLLKYVSISLNNFVLAAKNSVGGFDQHPYWKVISDIDGLQTLFNAFQTTRNKETKIHLVHTLSYLHNTLPLPEQFAPTVPFMSDLIVDEEQSINSRVGCLYSLCDLSKHPANHELILKHKVHKRCGELIEGETERMYQNALWVLVQLMDKGTSETREEARATVHTSRIKELASNEDTPYATNAAILLGHLKIV